MKLDKAYQPNQLIQLGLVILLLASSFAGSLLTARSAQAYVGTTSRSIKSVKPTDTGSQLQFSAAAYTATEGAAGIPITVNRSGSSTGAITVTVVLTDGTTSGNDYQFGSATGSPDPGFAPAGTGPNNIILGVAVQADGKFLIAGNFNSYNGTPVSYLARLNPDGSLDPSFNTGGVGADNWVWAVAVQPDGKILIGGAFANYNGVARNRLARLNANGSLDTTFTPQGSGPSNDINGIALQPDGKILIAGAFISYGSSGVRYIARLNATGTVDTSFTGGTLNGNVYGVAVQPDGKILVGGDFNLYNSTPLNRIARLNSDGTLDGSFNVPGTGPNSSVNTIFLLNGKIIIGGDFTSYNGSTTGPLAELKADGSIDPTFNPGGSGPDQPVHGIAAQADGKLLLGGDFTTYNNTPRNHLARINGLPSITLSWPDGDTSPRSFVITPTDDTFYEPTETASFGLIGLQGGATTGSPATATFSILDNDQPAQVVIASGNNQTAAVNSPFAQPLKAQVLTGANSPVGGVSVSFTAPNSGASGTFANSATNYTGTTDNSGYVTATIFTANTTTGPYSIIATASGITTTVSFALTNTVAASSINLTSSANPSIVDQSVTFTANVSPSTATDTVSFTIDSNSAVPVTTSNGIATYVTDTLKVGSHLVQINYIDTDTGAINTAALTQIVNSNTTLNFNSSAYTTTEGAAGIPISIIRGGSSGAVTATVILTDVTTNITDYQLANARSVATLDPTFAPAGAGPNNDVLGVGEQPDGKILIGGQFTSYNGVAANYLARLNPDGTLDPSFTSGANSVVQGIAVQKDGKILISGAFTTYSGQPAKGVARLNPDGSLDTSFNQGRTGGNSDIERVVVQPDGKILIAGEFTQYNGVARNYLARLNSDGSLDPSFNQGGAGPNNFLLSIALQPDGKIIISGAFSTYNGVPRTRIARLNPDGSLDTYFLTQGTGPGAFTVGVAVQPNGKILAAGNFRSYNDMPVNALVQLNSDGSFDTSFTPNAGPNNTIWGIIVQPDGKILIGGRFISYDGTPINRVGRLNVVQNLTFNWADEDSSPRSFVITATDDTLIEPTETALLGLTNLQGGASTGSPAMATLAILDNDTINQLNAIAGSNQITSRNTAFAQPLVAQVVNQSGGPISSVTVTFTAPTDGGASGTFANSSNIYTGTTDTSGLITTTTFTANSVAGAYNVAASISQIVTPTNFTLNNAITSTAVSLVSSPNPSRVGQTVTFTATISPSSASGIVNFTFDSSSAIPVTVSGGIATYITNTLTAGSHIITATYGGNATYAGASATPITQVVGFNNTSLSLTSSPNPSTIGQIVTFTATVSPAAASGTVTFTEGATVLGTATLSGGNAVFVIATLTVGSHIITATYGGDATYMGASSTPITQVVNLSGTTINLVSSPNPSTIGQGVTFTATVSPANASGSVTFTIDNASPTQVTLSGGIAIYVTHALSVGSHTVAVTYSGNAVYAGSTTTLNQIVSSDNASLSLTSDPNPSTVGQSVTFTATISPINATGTVTFTEGATVLGTANLSGGIAVYNTASLAVGSHVITATYGGNSTYTGATSQPITQVVQTGCQALVVTAITDDGTGTTCGTLSYALSQPVTGTTPVTITFALTQGNTITFTGSLTTTAAAKAYVVINGGTFGTTNRININGNGVSGDGLHLKGHNRLTNLTIYGFGARQLVLDGTGNVMQGVKVIA